MDNLDQQFKNHQHNGIDSQKLHLKNINGTFADIDGDLSDIVTPTATISDPTGGAVIDAEARTAIDDILDLLQAQGLME